MRVTNYIGVLLTGVTLVSTAAVNQAVLTLSNTPFKDLKLPAEFWAAMARYCDSGQSTMNSELRKRAVAPQGYTVISEGQHAYSYQVLNLNGIWTDHLVTCHGLVIVGDGSKPITQSKLLAHFFATDFGLDDLWTKVRKDFNVQDSTNIRAWLSMPDLNSVTDPLLSKGNMLLVENTMKDEARKFTGVEPTVRYHDMNEADARKGDIGTMQLNNADKTVMIDGIQIAYGT